MSSWNLAKEGPDAVKVGKRGKSGTAGGPSPRRDVELVVADLPLEAVRPPHGAGHARPEVEARAKAFAVAVDAPHEDEEVELLAVDAAGEVGLVEEAALGEEAKGEGVHDDGALAEEDGDGGVFGEEARAGRDGGEVGHGSRR